MKGQAYDFTSRELNTYFEFKSVGTKGTIFKVVMIDKLGDNIWNLAFGDKKEGPGLIDDETISNNGDLLKVIQTVVNITYDFFESHPDQRLLIRPVDEKRTSLYNHIFQRKWSEIRTRFNVFGVTDNSLESYQPEKTYDIFVVSLKSGIFEK